MLPKSVALSVISSDIALEKVENGREQAKADEKHDSAQVAESEDVGD